jgi:8-oxo-dGTP pyrophosphatase MutT (NUDIX family)
MTVHVVFAQEPFPTRVERTLFLAGPTPRSIDVESWRPEALRLLEARGWSGTVFVPEPRDRAFKGSYDDQVDWELAGLRRADAVLFWVPRDLTTLPGFTTNVEFGLLAASGRVVLGAPPDAPKTRYLRLLAERYHVTTVDRLDDAIDAAVALVGDGVVREDGACQVPAHVFRAPTFRAWHDEQRAAGNTLLGARLEWTLRTGPARQVFCWALHVDVFVRAENRRKKNEVVLGRPDVATVVLYRRDPVDVRQSEVALVREFRSAGATADGYVRETPGGSSWDPALGIREIAIEEVREEVGLSLAPERLRPLGARQVMATLSAHRAHAWAAELTQDEMTRLRADAGVVHGADDGERTTVEVWTLADLLAAPVTDWSTLGFVLVALA